MIIRNWPIALLHQPLFVARQFWFVGGNTRNIAIQLALQQCCKTSGMFFVACITVAFRCIVIKVFEGWFLKRFRFFFISGQRFIKNIQDKTHYVY